MSGFDQNCPFCTRILRGEYTTSYGGAVAFEPLNPVTPGHLLVVPRQHATDASCDPAGAAAAMVLAAKIVRAMGFHDDHPESGPHANIITSIGEHASQTVWHTHLHVVPRRAGDGLALPWTGQAAQE